LTDEHMKYLYKREENFFKNFQNFLIIFSYTFCIWQNFLHFHACWGNL